MYLNVNNHDISFPLIHIYIYVCLLALVLHMYIVDVDVDLFVSIHGDLRQRHEKS